MAAVSVSNPPVPQSPLWDEKAGAVSAVWYIFLSDLWLRTGGRTDGIANATPIGSQVGWPTATAPDNWLICDGAAVSRSTYSELFGVISTTFGSGDGSTTFNLPDPRGRSLIGAGQGAGLTLRAIAATGGAETVTLTEAELPTVTPSVNDPMHNHDIIDLEHSHSTTESPHDHANLGGNFLDDQAGTEYQNTGGDKGTLNAKTATASTGLAVDDAFTGITGTEDANTDITIGSFGNDDAHENMMPFLAMNVIIRAM